MTTGRYGRSIIDQGVVATETFGKQSVEAAGAIQIAKADQVIPAHLVDDKADDDLRMGGGASRNFGLRRSFKVRRLGE